MRLTVSQTELSNALNIVSKAVAKHVIRSLIVLLKSLQKARE